jgi:probable DNA repair protein
MLHPQLGLSGLIRIAENSRARAARLADLIRQLRALERTAERLLPEDAKQRPFAEWADAVRELLRAAGWATFTRDTSVEFQTRRKWESALDELATLDFEGTRPNFAEAVRSLEAILARTLFAPESRDAPVQIMSPREAAGSRFDAIFFLRCSDLAWPPSPGTNPLLGWRLQRELGMPGSDPALDAAHARSITARIAASAPTVVFSYARQTLDAHQRPSPLLAGLEMHASESLAPPEPVTSTPLEVILDPGHIPLANPKVRGGSAILKNQAACGFRAFAEARLASRPLDAPAAGLDASERGSIVHATMAYLWDDLRSQAALRALTLDQRRAVLDRAITQALDRVANHASPWDTDYLAIQRERLHRLIRPWLDEELLRAPFAVKSIEEKFADLAFGPLRLDLRLDRIDTLLDEHGDPAGEILLDYKTGDATPKDWQGDCPDDPQLPLYAALHATLFGPDSLAGVGFVRLRPGKAMGLLGHTRDAGLLLKASVPEIGSLDAQVEEWRRVLTALAEDFAAGDASVRPKSYPKTCAFCAQRLLCRIDPASLADGDHSHEDEDDSEGQNQSREIHG